MRNRIAFLLIPLWVVITAQIGTPVARADVVPPVNLQLKEVDSETVLAQWKVPVQIPVEATPRLIVPPHCLSRGDQATVDQPGGRVMTETFRCDGGIAGEEVGIEFPFYNASFTTMVRAELRSGEQFVQVLNPGEERWTLPEGSTGLRQDP